MCGIVGYIGKRNCSPLLLDGLSRLEYRGYDSAGLAVCDGTERLWCEKTKGRVASLRERCFAVPESTCGIAHTRWATHGEPNERNAHPHGDCSGSIRVVHNGIIENYRTLKEKLVAQGHTFTSDTDTEVLAHLVEQCYSGDFPAAVKEALHLISGAYGIAVIHARHPDTLIASRVGSPLVVGIGEDEHVVASDVTAIVPITRDVVYLEDGEIAVISGSSLTISDRDNECKTKDHHHIEWSLESAERQGYDHFMLKEIMEQPEAITNSTRGRIFAEEGTAKLGGLDSVQDRLRTIERLVIVGMGTARNAGLVGEYMLEAHAEFPVEVEFASEFGYRKSPLSDRTALLAISQSGETMDTCIALREARRKGLLTLGLVNVTGSSIARETDAGVYNHIGPEIAVASTKAFISQVTILALMTTYLGRMRTMSRATGASILNALGELPDLAKKILTQTDPIKKLAKDFARYEHFFYLGRGYNFPVALEGALKLKEIAYVHAEGYNGGEMKHGPIALIDSSVPTIILAPYDSAYEKNLSHIQELKVRGGTVIAIATEGNEEIATLADEVLFIPKTLEMLTPILSVIPLQLFAYYVALERGCDVDKPRNLAKSVTVE
ncbi:MAG: glutamine--fructose-6-phosphate transaminase (isomerizing) [Patescibacteria group bacterium]